MQPRPAPPEILDDDPLVDEVMTDRIVAITPDAPLGTALRLMASGDVRHLPVMAGVHCAGIVVEADVVRALAVGGARTVGPLARPVRRVPITARRSVVAGAVLDGGVDAVLVEHRGRLVGIVTTTDLVRSLAAGRAAR